MTEHDGCQNCKHFNTSICVPSESPCFDCEGAHARKTLYDKFKPLTNADRIRKMNDEEMELFLRKYVDCQCDFCLVERCFECGEECSQHVMEWLQSEAKESEAE